jgi:hypothetical protein
MVQLRQMGGMRRICPSVLAGGQDEVAMRATAESLVRSVLGRVGRHRGGERQDSDQGYCDGDTSHRSLPSVIRPRTAECDPGIERYGGVSQAEFAGRCIAIAIQIETGSSIEVVYGSSWQRSAPPGNRVLCTFT